MVLRCRMTETYEFNIKCDSHEEALDWMQTHDLADVRKETSAYSSEYYEEIIGKDEDDGCYVDLT